MRPPRFDPAAWLQQPARLTRSDWLERYARGAASGLRRVAFLKEAEDVTIATAGPQDLNEQERKQLDDVANYLQHHRVIVGKKIATSAHEADGQVLLGFADEQKGDLIVAGATDAGA